ncbi:MAG: hypothetical protein WCT49_01380 [Candidatus Paceibacterota bacterium]|jgi:hypothetical protein|nr:hypothetical protein [Candidatus Paceibacterota bacterium]
MFRSLWEKYRNWKFKNTVGLIIGLALFFYFLDHPLVVMAIAKIGSLGYFGAFLAGIFFVSTFTVAPAAVVIFYLAAQMDIWAVALMAGLGAVTGDFLIFSFLKDGVFEEIRPVFRRLTGERLQKLFETPHFGRLSMVLGAIIIASPLPDETGLALLGLSKIKRWQFFLLSFLLNSIGIFITISLTQL